MTSNEREEFRYRMQLLLQESEESISLDWIHEMADGILCELLEGLGYFDIVSLYRKIPKYY